MSVYINTNKDNASRVQYATCLWKEPAFREAQDRCIDCKREMTIFNAGEALFHQTSQKKVRDDFLESFDSTAHKTDVWTRYLALENTQDWQEGWQNWTSKYDTDSKIKAKLEELGRKYPSVSGTAIAKPVTATEILHPGSTVKQKMDANGTVFVVQCLEFKHVILSETIIVKTSYVKISKGLRKATNEEKMKMPQIPRDSPMIAPTELDKALSKSDTLTKVTTASISGKELLQEVLDGKLSKVEAAEKVESTDALKLEVPQVMKVKASTASDVKSQAGAGYSGCKARGGAAKRSVVRHW
ncbi:hypothetical protein PLICBS_000084 [Purpureocillium lilacinum]|uniref:uncharacterized protein n=1 Tax=Purpureocillium lilacinum TaxID=33203 RepID=UPI00207D8BD2|nr:hypothetical protein PLICBS_000084 [Purpureocillium lilacinum]